MGKMRIVKDFIVGAITSPNNLYALRRLISWGGSGFGALQRAPHPDWPRPQTLLESWFRVCLFGLGQPRIQTAVICNTNFARKVD